MIYTLDSSFDELLANEQTAAILERHLPGFSNTMQARVTEALSLRQVAELARGAINPETLQTIADELSMIPSTENKSAATEGDHDTHAVIVAFGDSITAANWPRFFAERLQTAQLEHLSVSNQGIGGNRLLHDSPPGFEDWFGRAAVERFERDVLDVPSAKYVIVLIGVNDLIHPATVAPAHQEVSAAEMIGGYQQLIAQAHRRGLKIFGGTILPFGGYAGATLDMEMKRQTINTWIRTGKAFDSVIDFDKTMRDPGIPTRLFPAYDSGDHLHPNDEGARALAEMVDLGLFSKVMANEK